MKSDTSGPVTLSIGSRFENIELAEFVCAYVLRNQNVNGNTAHWIKMALREGLANAIQHGNRQRPDKRVTIQIDLTPGRVQLTIEDEGEGFDPSAIGDPLTPENRLKTSGRGIFTMRNYMDEVRFSTGRNGGTVLVITKNLAASERKEESKR